VADEILDSVPAPPVRARPRRVELSIAIGRNGRSPRSSRKECVRASRNFANPVGYGHDDFIGDRVY
jgi:hypothetical protein